MAKIAYILFFILVVNVCSNDIVDLIRCIYQNFVPNIEIVFKLIDAIKAQDWMNVIAYVSQIYTKVKTIITNCKAAKAPMFL